MSGRLVVVTAGEGAIERAVAERFGATAALSGQTLVLDGGGIQA